MLEVLLFLLVGMYALVVGFCFYAWRNLPSINLTKDVPPTFFTVIIPVRNEAGNILALLQDLEKQQYPFSHFEVLVVDDHSDDATVSLVKQFQATTKLTINLLFLSSFPGKRQKKAAVEIGVWQAKGEWIACTDGDCRLSPLWLQAFNQQLRQQELKMISGPVVYGPLPQLWQRLQALEFSALIGIGAASIGLGKPTMCNGANLAYQKAAFLEVKGFSGNDNVPSGDDEFLLHKIHARYPGQVGFAKAKEAIVSTPAAETVGQFLQQRVRWASKWQHYDSMSSKLLALLVLAANISLVIALLFSWAGVLSWTASISLVLLKLGADALLLYQVLSFFNKKKLLLLIGLLQLVYVPYISLTAALGLKGKYLWKGRELTTT